MKVDKVLPKSQEYPSRYWNCLLLGVLHASVVCDPWPGGCGSCKCSFEEFRVIFIEEFMACCPVRSVDVDSAPRTCWHAREWAPRFWGSWRAPRICCWRCRLWSVSIWPCGSGTRFWPGPRWVWARARSASARWGTNTSYSETPSRVPAVFASESSPPPPALSRRAARR